MVSGLGIDIVQVERIASVYRRYGFKFARRVLAHEELQRFTQSIQPVRFLAMRFAAKEAASKALGTGFRRGVTLRSIEVTHNAAGKPDLRLHDGTAQIAAEQQVAAMHVSLTDERDYAAAVVVFERV